MSYLRPIRQRLFLPQLCVLGLCAGVAAPGWAVPSFARQTGMACAACHTVYPELTPFGREFKLNGYVLDNIKQINGITLQDRSTLSLNAVPPISMMLQVSYTHTSTALPDSALTGALAKNGDLLFPQQASLFYAGKIADNLGAFVQLTYDGVGDSFGFDNTDIRYARHVNLGAAGANKDLVIGITLNNSPTVQDPWNTTAAWGFPYSGSSVAPGPITSTKLDSGAGGLGQTAAGLGVYAWWNHSLYAELTLYSAAVRGGAHPLDSTQSEVIHGVSPYWRLTYEYRWDRNSVSVGTYGMDARLHPGHGAPLQGPTDEYRDIAADLQYQFIGENHLFTLLSTYIDEKQTLDASVADGYAANDRNTLKTFKLVGEYYYQRMIGGAVGFFNTSGSQDAIIYAAAPVSGSAAHSPDSRGEVLELDYLPWLNTKLQLQYVRFDKFNGGTTNYDVGASPYPVGTAGYVAGRNASDNDTLYALAWLNF
ncbi:MAG TPA: hypothetical protein VMV25_10400 [Steroidobacteraceae bacterium]|nr:hypothetical protein [Steroidobacteraceae bacterium]